MMLRSTFRLFSFVFVFGLFFGLSHGNPTACSPLTPSCPCRQNPTTPYSVNSNLGTTRAGDSTWYINGYFETTGQSDPDKSKYEKFSSRYNVTSNNADNVRKIQQWINYLAGLNSSDSCNSTCEDGRFGNNTISQMAQCLCADALEKPNPDGTCPEGFESDSKSCCKCKSPSVSALTGSCDHLPGHNLVYGKCCIPEQPCPPPKSIIEGECKCPDGGIPTGPDACCTGTPPDQVCECPGSKIRDGNNCVCPPGQKDEGGKCVCDSSQGCCGVQLNTVIPFIGDCIEFSNDTSAGNTTRVNALNAFPKLMGAMSRILVTVILIFSFVVIVVAGIMIITGAIKDQENNFTEGKKLILKVVIGLALLGASGIILRLINPNFFG